jgi:hypothetical protein
MDWPALLAWRMRRQQLAERAPAGEALGVVSRIAGLHAQVMASADASLRARVDGLPEDFLPAALWRDGTLVKTWAMRGTLHLLVRDELPTYVGALSRLRPRHHQGAWQRAYGVTREQADAMLAAIPKVLARKPLTRAELAAAVARRTRERPSRRAPSGCCPPSTRTSSPRRARRRPSSPRRAVPRSTARRAGSRPSCWSTA